MPIFHSPRRLQFGAPLPAPNDNRPTEALFVRGNTPQGFAFSVTWTYDRGAVGYHIFRSQSIRHVRDRSMSSLWNGAYGDSVDHFVIGDNLDTVIDNYRLRGATLMFYWVLSQDSAGNLRPVHNLQVRMADDFARSRKHLVLEHAPPPPQPPASYASPEQPMAPTTPIPRMDMPRTPPYASSTPRLARQPDRPPDPMVPTLEDEDDTWSPRRPTTPRASAPAAQPVQPAPARPVRQVFFITFTAPVVFQIQKDGPPAQSYQIFLGAAIPPSAEIADGMWDGALMPGNPMRCYTLPGNVEGFRDAFSPAGQGAYLAIFAIHHDGGRSQPALIIPHTPPAALADLT